MTFPFIEDNTSVLRMAIDTLNQNGLLVIADFNKDWVKECLKTKIYFADFDSNDNPKKGWKTFGNIRIPAFIRSSDDYDELTKQHGLIKLMDENPPFTRDFIKQYPDYRPNNIPEYLILGYKKRAH